MRRWVSERKPFDLYFSAVTVVEVELGIARPGRRGVVQAERLRTRLEDDVLAVLGIGAGGEPELVLGRRWIGGRAASRCAPGAGRRLISLSY